MSRIRGDARDTRLSGYLLMVSVLLFLWIPAVCCGRVLCVRLTCDHIADTTDLKRFGRFSAWRDKGDNERAIAIWRYLSDYETGLYHFNEILEGPDPFDEYATVRDPLKIMNTYNMAYCGIFGPVLDGIYHGAGFERGRSFGLQDWNHCATEVWYDGGWHYLDADVRGVLLRGDGMVASLAEAQSERELWTNPAVAIEPFFPKDHDKARVFDIYNGSPVHYYYRWFEMGHTMDFYLRRGESFTRFWEPQEDRWHHLERYSRTKWVRDLIEQEPKGPKPNHRDFTRWNHGNGVFEYAPRLSRDFSDFQDGCYSVKNLRPGSEGLEIVRHGEAEVVFEVFTPYIIVPKVNSLDDPSDDTDASIVRVAGARAVEVLVSLDHGLSWENAGTVRPESDSAVDLTAFVKGTYGYLLKLKTSGPAGSTAVGSLNAKTWVQVAPASIPALKKGKTIFQYGTGDRYGRLTIPMLVNPNTGDPEDLRKYVLDMPGDYNPNRHTCRILGEVVVPLKAPPGMKISWLTVGGAFRTHQGEHASSTDNRIAYVVGQPDGFKEIYRSEVPTWVNHWRYNWDGDVFLESPAEAVYVKYTANTGLNTIRACLHLQPERVSQDSVKITHGYRVNGTLTEAVRTVTGPSEYAVECEDEPENVFLKMAVPHGRVAAGGAVERDVPELIRPAFSPPAEFAGDFGSYRPPLKFDDGAAVNTAAQWRKRREEILSYWRGMIGAGPELIEKPRVEYLERERKDGLTQHRVRVEVAPGGQTVEGYLLVPDGEVPFPAVLVVYYDAETGVGMGKELRDFGYQLARRGFVVLSTGTPEFCSLKAPYRPLWDTPDGEPEFQPLGALAYVAANCFNALAEMPYVDDERIGVVGHSYGGKWAMFASCLYERFACAVWSDPGIVFDESRPNVNYWEPWYLGYEPDKQRERGVPTDEKPRTGAYKKLIAEGRDLHELHVLMAPRPFLVSGGAEDPPKRWQALNHSVAVNKVLGYADRVAMTNREGHSPTAESNEQMYSFFEHFLNTAR